MRCLRYHTVVGAGVTWVLKRNLLICAGLRSCGRCTETLPELASGSVYLTEASLMSLPIEQMLEECLVRALTLTQDSYGE